MTIRQRGRLIMAVLASVVVAPTHTYARPGTHTVTAVLFSGVGSAFPGAGAGPAHARTIRVGRRQ